MAARRLALDPVELRRRNLVDPDEMPYAKRNSHRRAPGGLRQRRLPASARQGTRSVRLGSTTQLARSGRRTGRRRGIGLAFFVEKSGIVRWEYARVELTSSGKTHVYSGGASVGQGLETALAQVCASTLGVDYDDVSVFHGDTATVPDGLGAFGSRAATLGGSAVLVGATRLRERCSSWRRASWRSRPAIWTSTAARSWREAFPRERSRSRGSSSLHGPERRCRQESSLGSPRRSSA